MFFTVSTGLVMGFGASLSCMASCVPIIVPFTAANENPGIARGLSSGLLFSAGRLLSYICLIAAFAWIKAAIPVNSLLILIATSLSGIILIFNGLQLTGSIKWYSSLGSIFCKHISEARSPIYLGILTGLKPCAPLIAAIAFALTLNSVIKISLFMFFFWLASSILVLLLMIAGGQVAKMVKNRIGIDRLRRIVGVAMVMIGFSFMIQIITIF